MNTIQNAMRELLRMGMPWCARDETKLTLDHLRVGNGSTQPDQARLYCEVCGVERTINLMLEKDDHAKWTPGTIVWNPKSREGKR